MTVFRVNIDRDEAEVVPVQDIWQHEVGKNKKGNIQSLSEISYQYYSTWRYWPLLWRANVMTLADFNPNKTKRYMKLLVPRTMTITQLDKVWCDRIWQNWDKLTKAQESLSAWGKEQVKQEPERDKFLCDAAWQSWGIQPAGIIQ